jgi:general secretion pathway protein M
VAAWCSTLAPRERRLAGIGSAVLALGLLWALAVQPAWQTLARAPAEHDRLDAQLQVMQRDAAEAQQLRATPPLPQDQAAAALRAATDRLGDKARLTLQADRAVVTLNGVGSGALRDWLAEARAGARVRPVEATLSRSPQGFTGTVVLAFGVPS